MRPVSNVFLYVRQKKLQKKYGQEAEAFVAMLAGQYRISGCNMEETIERIIREGEGIHHTKKLLCVMLHRIRKSHEPEEIKAAAASFATTIGTSWAFMLAANFYAALTRGIDVSASLGDVLGGLSQAKKLLEERRRASSESVRMAKFVTPGLYMALVMVSMTMGIAPGEFMHRQLHTAEGLQMFALILILALLSQMLLFTFGHKKFDY